VNELLGSGNKECGPERGADGLVTDEAQEKPAADELGTQLMETMKRIDCAEKGSGSRVFD
jgi:hypothetical protein